MKYQRRNRWKKLKIAGFTKGDGTGVVVLAVVVEAVMVMQVMVIVVAERRTERTVVFGKKVEQIVAVVVDVVNKAGYTAQDAPSTRLKITWDIRTDGRTDGRTD